MSNTMAQDFGLTSEQVTRIIDAWNDLKIQAMMFDMQVDWESLELVPKRKDVTPIWIKKWREKFEESDYTVYDNGN